MEKFMEFYTKTTSILTAYVLTCIYDVGEVFGLVCILLLFDNIVAIWRAYIERNGKWFDRSKMKITLRKFISYCIAFIVAWIVEKMTDISFGITTWVSYYICIYETISIFSHLSRITGLQIFADLVDWLKNKIDFKKYFKNRKNEI